MPRHRADESQMSDWSLSLFEQSNSLHLPHSCPFHCIITNLAGGSICLYWEHEAAFVHLTVTFAAGRGREGDKMYSQKGRDSCLNKLQIHLAPHCCFREVWMGHWNLSSREENCVIFLSFLHFFSCRLWKRKSFGHLLTLYFAADTFNHIMRTRSWQFSTAKSWNLPEADILPE